MSRLLEQIPLPLGRHWGWGLRPRDVRGKCAMGVDVRPDSWDVAIFDAHRPWKHKPDHMPLRLVFNGKVRDEMDVIWLAFQYPVAAMGIDSRPEATLANRLVKRLRKARKDAWRVQYNTNPSTVEFTKNEKEHQITLERTMAMDELFVGMQCGQIALPQNYQEVMGGTLVSELCAPTRVQVEWHGQDWPRWTEKEADHTFHCMTYGLFMAKFSNIWTPSDAQVMAGPGLVQTPGGPRVATPGQARRDPFDEEDGDDEEQDWADFYELSSKVGF